MDENLFKKISEMLNKTSKASNTNDFQNMFSNISFSEKNDNNPNYGNLDLNNLDMETLFKIKKIMDKFSANQQSPSTNLLKSLKPYLKTNKKDKIDQYIQLINIASALDLFGKNGD